MAQTLADILDALLAQRGTLEAYQRTVQDGLSDIQALYDDSQKMRAFGNASDRCKEILLPLRTWMQERVWSHLEPRFAQGAMAAIDPGIRTPFTDRWNTLIADTNPADYLRTDVVTAVADVFQKALGFGSPFEPTSWDAATIEAFVDAGTVATPTHVMDDMLVCFYSGGNMALALDGWNPTLYETPRKGGKKLVVATPRDDRTLLRNSITFPTGRILVADKMPFAQVQAAIDSLPRLNINYTRNRIMRSTLLCQTQGIVQISVGNTDPSVHVHDGQVLVGRMEHLAPQAGTETDLWMVTMVDMAHVLAMGVAQDEIDAALADGTIESFTIPPGTWNIVWSEEASPETTAERFAPLYPHAPDDQLMFWMTQDIAPVQALDTWTMVDLTELRF